MSQLNEFLLTTGRTLAQMALYTVDHPSVKGSLQASFEQVVIVLQEFPELVLSVNENKLLVNGRIQEGLPEVAVRPFIQLLTNFDLHSLSFHAGVEAQELVPFFQLASKGDAKKLAMSAGDYFASKNVTHIKVNQAKYAKIGEDDVVAAKGSVGTGSGGMGGGSGVGLGGSEPVAGSETSFLSEVEGLRLDELLRKLIEKSVSKADERKQVLGLVTQHIKLEIEDAVNKATASIKKENVKVSNERDRTESVMESVADGVVVVDESGNVVMMNPVAEQIYGVTLSECVGKPLWQGVHGEQMIALAKDLTIPTDRPVVKEVQLRAAQETKRVLRTSAATVQDTNGRVVGMVTVLSDVTKQKELTRLQNEFMANVTHDLRTPIHALKLAVCAILEGAAGAVSTEQEKMLTLANRNVERLSRLIDDLLDFSQVESGTLKINLQVTELNPLIRESVQGLDAWVKSRGINLSFEETKDLPAVYADSDRVLQIVINLISNAIKFTPSGGHVIVRAKPIREAGKTLVQIDVEDSGSGISADDQKRIFARFVQLSSSEKLEIRGTGLGLSICKALVELHKGTLWVQSPPTGKPKGSLFSFTLPTFQKTTNSVVPSPVKPVTVAPVKKGFWKKIFSKFGVGLLIVGSFSTLCSARPYNGTVRRVLGPDLIQLNDGTRLHLQGIQMVEKGHPLFSDAFAESRQWVQGKEVALDYGPDERSPDGTWNVYVYVEGVFINEELVRSGFALVKRLENDEKVLRLLVVAEREAKRGKRGLWGDIKSEIPELPVAAPNTNTLPRASDEDIRKGFQ